MTNILGIAATAVRADILAPWRRGHSAPGKLDALPPRPFHRVFGMKGVWILEQSVNRENGAIRVLLV